MTPIISVLVAARKDSKYLAKFLFGYYRNTLDWRNTEILVMLNQEDTWNAELVTFFGALDKTFINNGSAMPEVIFFQEDYGLGRAGLHEYFNELLKHARGDWILYACEDHFLFLKGWDDYVRQIINGGSRALNGKEQGKQLDPKKPWCIVPKFDNAGAMSHILSRGYIEALGNVIARHGWVDSYINDVNHEAFGIQAIRTNNKEDDVIIKMDDEMLHDFTHDHPSPMSEAGAQSVSPKPTPKYKSPEVKKLIKEDAERLKCYEP